MGFERSVSSSDADRWLVVESPIRLDMVRMGSPMLLMVAVFRRRKGIARMAGFMESDVVVTAPLFHVCGRGRIQSKGTGG